MARPLSVHQAAPGLTVTEPRAGDRRRLGDVIVELGYADRDAIESAVGRARARRMTLGKLLVTDGVIDDEQLARALAERNGLAHVDLNAYDWDRGAASLISPAHARRYGALPIAFVDENALIVAITQPANLLATDDIAMATGYEVRRAVTTPAQIEGVLAQLSRLDDSVHEIEERDDDGAAVIELRAGSAEAPIVKLVNTIVADAVERGASDIHIEPRRGDLRVRFRVDGMVSDATTVPRRMAAAVLSRLKLMAELDIAERRLPQDGRVGLTVDGRFVDLRVATLPVVHGEAAVIRILDKGRVSLELPELGLRDSALERFESAIAATSGAVLVTGPTGSGKTTTLYAALDAMTRPERTLVTLEDPVEFELEGVKQVQVSTRTGLTFATGLRSLVRSDPDVLMVGEVRDRETAQIAMESALTGHIVLTTLHTNDAPVAVARLVEMGIEPFLVASGVECVLAQRLVRRLCDCKREVKLSAATLRENGFAVQRGFRGWEPGGCLRCSGTGYRGRVGIYEVMTMSPALRELALAGASAGRLRAVACDEGMSDLRADGLEKARGGMTSVPEVLRVLGSRRSA